MHKESETLRQRKKAQQDLLELKKIQRGEIDAEVLKDDDKKIVPETLSDKMENFFFYHKYKILGIGAILVVLAIIVTSIINTPKYDATITIYCHEFVGESEIEDTGKWITRYYPDVNGNGRVEVLSTDCSISPDTDVAEVVRQRQLKMQSLLTEKDALLFILDDDSLKYLNSITESFTLFEKENIVQLSESFYNALADGRTGLLPEKKHYLCLRSVDGSAIEGKAQQDFKFAKEVLEKIKRDSL